MRVVAIVPMRHTSDRVPGKNYRPFAGRPLFHHIVETLLACPRIDEVVIDTDSDLLRDDAAEHFPKVTVLERPVHLRADTTPMNDVLLNTIAQVEADLYLQTHSTNPLLRPSTIDRAVGALLEAYPIHDSLFSVTRAAGAPVGPAHAARSTTTPRCCCAPRTCRRPTRRTRASTSSPATTLRQRHNRIGERPLLFEIERAGSHGHRRGARLQGRGVPLPRARGRRLRG